MRKKHESHTATIDHADDDTLSADPLERLTREIETEQFLATVANTDLPTEVAALADTYDELIGVRDRFPWKWLYTSVTPVRLSCVPAESHETVRTVKTLTTMFVTAVDDIADRVGDQQLLTIIDQYVSDSFDATVLDQTVWETDVIAQLEFVCPSGTQSGPISDMHHVQTSSGRYSCSTFENCWYQCSTER